MSTVPGGSPAGPEGDRSALEAAYMDLRERVAATDHAGDWRERTVLEPLTEADFVRRVGDHGDSPHYRADKASELTSAAVRLLRETFLVVLWSVAHAVSEGRGDNPGAVFSSDAAAITGGAW